MRNEKEKYIVRKCPARAIVKMVCAGRKNQRYVSSLCCVEWKRLYSRTDVSKT